ncbi:hypothetical protein [Roseateles sp. P5_E11]
MTKYRAPFEVGAATRPGGELSSSCRKRRSAALRLSVLLWPLLLGGCGALTVPQRNQAALVAIAGVGAAVPGSEVAQTYYLGSFDPRGQLPPTVYRIRVRGQASVLNQTRFASGWAPAGLVDSLTGSLSLDVRSGNVAAAKAAESESSLGQAGRGLVMFGPEGFREAPRDHRLIIMMGSNPEMIEQAFSSALGTVARVRFGQPTAALDRELFDLLISLGQERARLESLAAER